MNNPIRVSIVPGDYQGCGCYRMLQFMEEMNYVEPPFHLMNLGPVISKCWTRCYILSTCIQKAVSNSLKI